MNVISQRAVQAETTELAYLSGFGNGFETEALPGRAPGRAQFAAKMRLRALCRAAQRLAFHRAAGHQRTLLALPHQADRHALGAVQQGRCRSVAQRALRRD